MTDVLRIKDGATHIVMNRQDLLELIDFTSGDEVRRAVETMIRDIEEEYLYEADTIDEIRTEAEKQKEAYQEKLRRLKEASDGIAEMIQAREIDRAKLSGLCGEFRRRLDTAPF